MKRDECYLVFLKKVHRQTQPYLIRNNLLSAGPHVARQRLFADGRIGAVHAIQIDAILLLQMSNEH